MSMEGGKGKGKIMIILILRLYVDDKYALITSTTSKRCLWGKGQRTGEGGGLYYPYFS